MFFARRVPPEARDAYNKDALSGVLVSVMTGMTLPFVVVIARKTLHASAFEIGVLTMAPVVGYPLSLVWANIAQGRRKVPYAAWPCVIARALFFLVALATCSKVFVGIYLLFWLFTSVASPAYTDVMKEIYPDSDRAKIMGFVRVCAMTAYLIMTLVGGELLKHVSYRIVFPIAAAFGVASSLVFTLIHSPATTGLRDAPLSAFVKDSIQAFVAHKGFLWFSGGIFIFGFANFIVAPSFALYEVDVLHVATVRASYFCFVQTALTLFGYFYWGHYLDGRRPEKVVALQSLVWGLVPLMYLFSTQWWMLMPAKVIAGFIGAGCDLAYFMGVIHYAPSEKLSQYQGVFLTLMGIRGMTGPFIGGWLVDHKVMTMQQMFVLTIGLTILSAMVIMIGYRKYPSKAAGHQ